ncbi:MAG TPA: adenylate/guanylate cyclase domain-containing protein [Gemmatimonadota bacterium]|nr:adenylate/guanylate cyclase domain-containing protein [Gemmatimonadota bacterium]
MEPRRSLTAILFTDIVDSTRRAAELGDREWRKLLDDHHARVRRELRRFGGREANTAGDGFMAVFDRPATAIRCADAIRTSMKDLGLEIRSGVHAGEVDGRGRDLGGLGVHIGARVAAAAAPGEILVSSTVRELVVGAGFKFEDRGERELKGVPGAWHLFALTELPPGPGFRTGRWIPEMSYRQAGIVAVGALAVIGLVVVLFLGGRWGMQRIAPGPALAESAAPGIAVLPFTVNDPQLDQWREGMVDLLATNLDGAGGFRAIDNRTVLARWAEAVPEGQRADLETLLDVARKTGARYAVAGDVVTIGAGMRLTADLYDIERGEPVGHAQAEGSPDSLFVLIDRLSIDLLGALLEEGGGSVPSLNLSRVTTSSVPALKAYLEGEGHFRRSDWENAVVAYKSAVTADSTFALAHLRLSQTYGWWSETEFSDLPAQEAELARRYVDRLPERERLLVEGEDLWFQGSMRSVEFARDLVQRYPDDVDAWFFLGEILYHEGGKHLIDIEESKRAFFRAIELDPRFTPAYLHPIDLAFGVESDSARAADLIARFREHAPGSEDDVVFGIDFALAFGSADARAAALHALDTLNVSCFRCKVVGRLSHPTHLAYQESALRLLLARDIDDEERGLASFNLFLNQLERGKLSACAELLGSPHLSPRQQAEVATLARMANVPVPAELLESALTLPPDSASGPATFLLAAAAVDLDRPEDLRRGVRLIRAAAADRTVENDSLGAQNLDAVADALEGYAMWRRGDAAGAWPVLESAQKRVAGDRENAWIRWWLSGIATDLGRPEDAIRYLESLTYYFGTTALYPLARAYEEEGRREEARQTYELLLTAWSETDPAQAARVAEVRQRLAGLGMSPRG